MNNEHSGLKADTTIASYGGRIDRLIQRGSDHVMAMSPATRFAVALALVAVVAMLDDLTGEEVSVSIFYLVPVAFAGGFVSRRAGLSVAAASAVAWGVLEHTSGRPYSAHWILLWNSGVRLGFFYIVNALIDALRRMHTRERMLSRTDALTGIANSRVFNELAERTISLSRRNGSPFTIAYVDLDRFKQVNDEFGHSEGDRLLRAVASHIMNSVRTTDTVARLGGDEFCVLMPETGLDQARVSLERVVSTLDREVGSRWSVGATIGAVTFNEPPEDTDSAIRLADALMYQGKGEGRGRILQSTWPESAGKGAT